MLRCLQYDAGTRLQNGLEQIRTSFAAYMARPSAGLFHVRPSLLSTAFQTFDRVRVEVCRFLRQVAPIITVNARLLET